MVIQFSPHNLFETLSFLRWVFLAPLSNVSCLYIWGCISECSVLFHWSTYLLLCQHHTSLITIWLQNSLKLGSMKPPALLFLRIVLTIGVFWLQWHFRIFFLFLWKMPLESWQRLHWICILQCRILWVKKARDEVSLAARAACPGFASILMTCYWGYSGVTEVWVECEFLCLTIYFIREQWIQALWVRDYLKMNDPISSHRHTHTYTHTIQQRNTMASQI